MPIGPSVPADLWDRDLRSSQSGTTRSRRPACFNAIRSAPSPPTPKVMLSGGGTGSLLFLSVIDILLTLTMVVSIGVSMDRGQYGDPRISLGLRSQCNALHFCRDNYGHGPFDFRALLSRNIPQLLPGFACTPRHRVPRVSATRHLSADSNSAHTTAYLAGQARAGRDPTVEWVASAAPRGAPKAFPKSLETVGFPGQIESEDPLRI